jgi:hypothetical protein
LGPFLGEARCTPMVMLDPILIFLPNDLDDSTLPYGLAFGRRSAQKVPIRHHAARSSHADGPQGRRLAAVGSRGAVHRPKRGQFNGARRQSLLLVAGMPRACPVVDYAGFYITPSAVLGRCHGVAPWWVTLREWQPNEPRGKPVGLAKTRGFALETSLTYHGASPWDWRKPAALPQKPT